jgi:hypothetical protein
MKKIKISRGYLVKVDDEDFEYLNSFTWTAIPKEDGRIYATRMSRRNIRLEKRHVLQMHREIVLAPKGKVVDHINHDTLDNRKSNLRICTHSENMRNRKIQKNNISGFRGVSFSNRNRFKKWMVHIRIGEKYPKYMGSFITKEDAALAYNKAAIKYHKEFASLNII